MSIALLVAAFLMGFLGSPHCLGMCGGIVTAFSLSLKGEPASKQSLLVAGYHLGRLVSYMILGVVVGFLGASIFNAFMHNQWPRIVMGLALVLIGASMLGLPFLNALERLGLKLWQALAPLRQKVLPLNSLPKALFAGLLWGFLPCGLVYGALLLAVSANDALGAASIMFAFGLGTTPMLLATAGAASAMQAGIKKYKLRLINGVLLILSGLAIAFIPVGMKVLHGGHGSHGGHDMHGGNMPMTHDMQHMPGNDGGNGMSNDMENHAHMNHDTMNQGNMDHDSMNHDSMNHDAHQHMQHGGE